MGKNPNPRSGSGMNNDISESLEKNVGVIILKFFYEDADPESF
jgi:hypothetical protein